MAICFVFCLKCRRLGRLCAGRLFLLFKKLYKYHGVGDEEFITVNTFHDFYALFAEIVRELIIPRNFQFTLLYFFMILYF